MSKQIIADNCLAFVKDAWTQIYRISDLAAQGNDNEVKEVATSIAKNLENFIDGTRAVYGLDKK